MSADPPAFLDTNVLVYAFDRADDRKRHRAAALLDDLARAERLRISTQVLQEFFVTVTRKVAEPMSTREALEIMADLECWPVTLVDPAAIQRAGTLTEEASLSFWDALIVVAAQRSGASTLYTEDLNHGQEILGVVVVNPFLE